MAATYNDGTVQYGARTWVIRLPDALTERDTYEADNITINRPTKSIDRTNHLGEPTGSVGVADFVTGSASLQLDADAAKEPLNGDLIICDGTVNDHMIGTTDETFFVTSVSRTETKDGEKKVNITFKKKYGA